MRRRIYVSGPMRGQDFDKVFDRFYKAEALLRNMGYDVINPLHIAQAMPFLSHEEYLQLDRSYIQLCDVIYLLAGWQRSEGCRIELNWAKRNKLEVMYEETPLDPAWAFDRPGMREAE